MNRHGFLTKMWNNEMSSRKWVVVISMNHHGFSYFNTNYVNNKTWNRWFGHPWITMDFHALTKNRKVRWNMERVVGVSTNHRGFFRLQPFHTRNNDKKEGPNLATNHREFDQNFKECGKGIMGHVRLLEA